MARKSSKTSHVLNLIAGQDTDLTPEEKDTGSAGKIGEDAPAAPASEAAAPPAPSVETPNGSVAHKDSTLSKNISVIDKTEQDPIAELIQQQLASELEKQLAGNDTGKAAPEPEALPTPETASSPTQEPVPEPEPDSTLEPLPEPELDPTPEPLPDPEPLPEPKSDSISTEELTLAQEPGHEPASTSMQASAPEQEPAPVPTPNLEPIPTPEPLPEPEPEPPANFASVNVMERIVSDKIIYFMRQFDVCTCDRCVSDAIALTLNGLAPKYIVTDPFAVDPLISFYTNRYIVDVTVEATKACAAVKENPRH